MFEQGVRTWGILVLCLHPTSTSDLHLVLGIQLIEILRKTEITETDVSHFFFTDISIVT